MTSLKNRCQFENFFCVIKFAFSQAIFLPNFSVIAITEKKLKWSVSSSAAWKYRPQKGLVQIGLNNFLQIAINLYKRYSQ